MFTYLTINLCVIAIPLAFSFERRVGFCKKWRPLFSAILISGSLFIAWDILFTAMGVWGFNHHYLVGLQFLTLPFEEALFFFCVPYACLFIYEVLLYFRKKSVSVKKVRRGTLIFAVILIVLGVIQWNRLYTVTTFCLFGAALLLERFIIRGGYMGLYYKMLLISYLPFLIVNGVLTHGLPFIDAGPVVWYSDWARMGLRIGSIPVEDFIYSAFLLWCNVALYACFKKSGKSGK